MTTFSGPEVLIETLSAEELPLLKEWRKNPSIWKK